MLAEPLGETAKICTERAAFCDEARIYAHYHTHSEAPCAYTFVGFWGAILQ
jgi:hypothetical protein